MLSLSFCRTAWRAEQRKMQCSAITATGCSRRFVTATGRKASTSMADIPHHVWPCRLLWQCTKAPDVCHRRPVGKGRAGHDHWARICSNMAKELIRYINGTIVFSSDSRGNVLVCTPLGELHNLRLWHHRIGPCNILEYKNNSQASKQELFLPFYKIFHTKI